LRGRIKKKAGKPNKKREKFLRGGEVNIKEASMNQKREVLSGSKITKKEKVKN